jgi:glycosyltransferase AglE
MNFPKISVVVPVYNAKKDIKELTRLLSEQNYPNNYEVIFVDNNSTDNTYQVIKKFINENKDKTKAKLKLLEQDKIQSSYATRNKGVKDSRYNILAFTDSDCLPKKGWLKEGISKMIETEADLVGGNVEFTFKNKNNPAEILDSITNMQNKRNINERGVAKTANLFVKKDVFKKIGLFPDNFTSGGDVLFTKKATDSGFKIAYAPKAIVSHPTRTLRPLLKKQKRVGRGKVQVWKMRNYSTLKITYKLLSYFKPPTLSTLKRAKAENNDIGIVALIQIWLIAYLCKMYTLYGAINKLFTNK